MRTTLYIGVTNDLERRMFEHKTGHGSNFCKKYNISDLMYYEEYTSISDAIDREKQLKCWRREWKWELISGKNKLLQDLSKNWFTREHYENIKACRKLDHLEEYYRES